MTSQQRQSQTIPKLSGNCSTFSKLILLIIIVINRKTIIFPKFIVYSALARSQGLEGRFHQQLIQSRCLHRIVGRHWEGQAIVSGNIILL